MKDMKSKSPSFALLMLLSLSTLATTQAQTQADLKSQYVGTWRLISAKYGGQDAKLSEFGVTIKHITPTQFIWLSYNQETGKISRAGGGTYTLSGGSCKETVQYGIGDDYEAIKGKEQDLYSGPRILDQGIS